MTFKSITVQNLQFKLGATRLKDDFPILKGSFKVLLLSTTLRTQKLVWPTLPKRTTLAALIDPLIATIIFGQQ